MSMAHQGLVGTLIIKGIPEAEAVAIADQYLAMALEEGRLSTPSENRVTLKGTPERQAVFSALVAPMAGGPILHDDAKQMIDDLVAAAAREQARLDAELMQKMSDRSPTAPASKGGTNSRTVYASAANILHPDKLGWSLELPEHLRNESEGGE